MKIKNKQLLSLSLVYFVMLTQVSKLQKIQKVHDWRIIRGN